MYLLIDSSNHQLLARHARYSALAALHYIQFANVDGTILSEEANREFSRFDENELRTILKNSGCETVPKKGATYGDVIRAVRDYALSCDWMEFPYAVDEVVQQADKLSADESKPARFVPGVEFAKVGGKWSVGKQGNRARRDSTYASNFMSHNGGQPRPLWEPQTAPMDLPWIAAAAKVRAPAAGADSITSATPAPGRKVGWRPEEPTELRSYQREAVEQFGVPDVSEICLAPAKTKRAKAPKPEKQPRAPAAPSERPKAGTTTAKVWDIADALLKTQKGKISDAKSFRAAVINECVEAGINSSTASVQFGKWKASTSIQ